MKKDSEHEPEPEWTRETAGKMLMYELEKGARSGGEQPFSEFDAEFRAKFGIQRFTEEANESNDSAKR